MVMEALAVGVPKQAPRAGIEAALPCNGAVAQCQYPRAAGGGPHFSGAFWFCKGMREHCRIDVGTWKSEQDTVFYKVACVWIENLHNMDVCQSGNILESVVRAASRCDLLLYPFMPGLQLGEIQVFEFKSKLEQFQLCCHLAYWVVKKVEHRW